MSRVPGRRLLLAGGRGMDLDRLTVYRSICSLSTYRASAGRRGSRAGGPGTRHAGAVEMRASVIAWVLGSTLAAQAGLGGRWAGSISADGGPPHPLYARFERDGGAVTGAIGSDSTRLAAIANARVSGDTIRFDARWGDV